MSTNGTRATPQAGILEGANPIAWSASNPISLFIIQAAIIIIFCRLLHYPLSLLGQPRVIAEVIGGILLGPSVMMRIPGFQDAIFPTASMPVLSNVANIALILFLFLVALELDVRLFSSNWRVALSVGLAGMILPFGLGIAIAYGIYHQFKDPGTVPISFGVFALFVGTALAITAFPVLCRILTELKLLGTSVGVTVLAAGIGNDVTGWILLALCVALVNNSSGLAALWALLCCVGWALTLVFLIRPVFHWCLRKTGSLKKGPTQGMVALTLVMALVSAWFTGIIGVHPIFGAFMVGLICPHDGGFAIKLTEKIEDLVSVLFLPLYFALSGLSTNLGLLNDGITWAYVIGIIAIAFTGKIVGGTLAARSCRLVWRESLTIGVLMSCKGLVELIVLNIGLQAKILSARTFTMFVVMALITTVATTPLTRVLFPPWYQKKLEKWKKGEIDWDGNPVIPDGSQISESSLEKLRGQRIQKLLVQIRLDALPSLFRFIALLGGPKNSDEARRVENTEPGIKNPRLAEPGRRLEVCGLRILELTERTSSVMRVAEAEELARQDPVVQAFTTFSRLQSFAVSECIAVVPPNLYAETIMNQASDSSSDFVLIPWCEPGDLSEDQSAPLRGGVADPSRNQVDFVAETFQKAVCNVGVFISDAPASIGGDRPKLARAISGLSIKSVEDGPLPPFDTSGRHIFLPFFGGIDDRLCLRLVLQMAENPTVSVTIAHFRPSTALAIEAGRSSVPHIDRGFEESAAEDASLIATLQSSLPSALASRVIFVEVSVAGDGVMKEAAQTAKRYIGSSRLSGDIVVAGRRHSGLPEKDSTSADMKRATGIVGERMVLSGLKASVLVVQAAGKERAQ